jgi:hypothetical protein
MKLVILITAQVEHGLDVAQAWQDAGASGVTIVQAHGLHALQEELSRGAIELPRMVSSMAAAMAAVLNSMEAPNQILLSLVDDDLVDALIAGASSVLGDLTLPKNGILFVIPVERALGVYHHGKGGG